MKSRNVPVANLITREAVRAKLGTKIIGRQFLAFRTIHSTNDLAYRLASEGGFDGTVVIAEEQTAGRGRLGRKWESCFGKGLWFSVIFRPDLPSTQAGLFSFLAGISVADAFSRKIQLVADLKWPNDLLIGKKKVCGILSEAEFDENRIKFIILGIGINVNHSAEDFPETIRQQATSIYMLLKQRVNRVDLLVEILQQLEFNYFRSQQQGFKGILADWCTKCSYLGKQVKFVSSTDIIEGIFETIADDGSAIIRLHNGIRQRILVGDMIPD